MSAVGSQSEVPTRVTFIALGVTLLVLSLLIIASAWALIAAVARVHKYQPYHETRGELINVSLRDAGFSGSGMNSSVLYALDGLYRYRVGGIEHISTQITRPRATYGHSEARERALALRAASELTVYYDPEAPAESILIRPALSSLWAPAIGTCVFAAIWLGMLAVLNINIRRMKSRKETVAGGAA